MRTEKRIEILRKEYARALMNPLFDNPADYCILLDLIQDEIERLEVRK